MIFTVLLFVGGFASYLYRLRFVSRHSSWEVAEGVVLAFLVVGGIAVVMWRIGRYLEGK
jgi:Na+/pantothenate symporter